MTNAGESDILNKLLTRAAREMPEGQGAYRKSKKRLKKHLTNERKSGMLNKLLERAADRKG